MSDFDDEEYESFDLDGSDADPRPGTTPAVVVSRPDDDDDDDEDEDDDDDLEELIVQLRRLPGDAGALGFVSLVEEVFVLVRVRGQHVQVLLNDATAAADWPLAHDVADLLDEDIPDSDDDDAEPMGDLSIVADLGMSEFDLGALLEDLDLGSDQMLIEIADKINLNPQFRRLAEAAAND